MLAASHPGPAATSWTCVYHEILLLTEIYAIFIYFLLFLVVAYPMMHQNYVRCETLARQSEDQLAVVVGHCGMRWRMFEISL